MLVTYQLAKYKGELETYVVKTFPEWSESFPDHESGPVRCNPSSSSSDIEILDHDGNILHGQEKLSSSFVLR